jgi:REP element-mobilizing transposase RayT
MAEAQPRRQSLRLAEFDYAEPGAYFVTICTRDRACLFGEVVDGEMILSPAGRVVEAAWFDLPNHYPTIGLDAFVVMPNHVHGIIVISGGPADSDSTAGSGEVASYATPAPTDADLGYRAARMVGAGFETSAALPRAQSQPALRPNALRPPLSEVVRGFKTFSARRINAMRGTSGSVWQRNYYEHIIRSDRSLQRIRTYIDGNPGTWEADHENPAPWNAALPGGRV